MGCHCSKVDTFPENNTAEKKNEISEVDESYKLHRGFFFDYYFQYCYKSQFLFSAVEKGDIETIKELVKYGANIHEKNENGETALHRGNTVLKIYIYKYFL